MGRYGRPVNGHTTTSSLLLALVFGVVGCGDSGDPPERAAAPELDRGAISKDDVPMGEWPLTVKEGVVRCEGGGSVIFRAPDDTDYAVNGTALTQRPGLPKIDAIWRNDPDVPGLRINIGPVLNKGLELCE